MMSLLEYIDVAIPLSYCRCDLNLNPSVQALWNINFSGLRNGPVFEAFLVGKSSLAS